MNHAQMVLERFSYRGLQGCHSCCHLELLQLAGGRTAVIATELKGNGGTSVTNVAEHLASYVCDHFSIDPDKLVWIEHYGYPSPTPGIDRTYDLVTFTRQAPERVVWFPAVTRHHPDGWPGFFQEPDWKVMTDEDWKSLGLELRR